MRRLFMVAVAGLVVGCHSITPETDTEATAESVEALCPNGGGGGPHGGTCGPGELDTTFGPAGTGVVRLSIGAPDDAGGIRALAFADDEKILTAGEGFGGLGGSVFVAARLTPDGMPDSTFAGGAVVRTHFGPPFRMTSAGARGVGAGEEGRLIAIGTFEFLGSMDIALARYTNEGVLDPRFATDGQALVDLGGSEIVETGLVLPDGRILAAGSRDGQVLAAAFTPEGALDTSFASPNGYFTAPLGDASSALSLLADRGGRIVAAGFVETSGQRDVLLMRLTADGQLDTSFGGTGYVIAGDPGVDERAVAIAVTSGHKYVVAGDAGTTDDRDFQVRRFRTNGRVDYGFGTRGVTTVSVTPFDDQATGMGVLPNGRIVMVGNSIGGGRTPVAVRFKSSGALDDRFGTGGVLRLDLGESGVVNTIQIDPEGRAVIAGGDEGGRPGPGTFLVAERMCM